MKNIKDECTKTPKNAQICTSLLASCLQNCKQKTNNIIATTKFYLDTRSGEAPYPLKLTITHERKSVYLSLGVKLNPEQWDGNKILKHPRAQMLNNQLLAHKADIDCQIYEWQRTGKLNGKSAKDIKEMIDTPNETIRHTIGNRYETFFKKRNGRTRELYAETLKRMREYADIDNMTFEGITPEWLISFDNWPGRRSPSINARAIHLRIYRDLFMLIIMMRGINIGDLCLLKDDNIINGRVVYRRQKTHTFYSIKLEPEAYEIIKKYKGKNYLLNVCDRYLNF